MNISSLLSLNSSLVLLLGLSFAINGLFAYFWHQKLYRKLGLKNYKAIQRIHLNETPRLGGLVFISSLIFYFFYCNTDQDIFFFKFVLISILPAALIAFKEDLFHDVDPTVRLISLLFSGFLFYSFYEGPFPLLNEIPIIGHFFLFKGVAALIFILFLVTIANGMNLADGVNGLCCFIAIGILTSLLFLTYKLNDIGMLKVILILLLFLIPFVLLNYPYGKIFLGDLGAYSIGLIISIFVIILLGRHPNLPIANAILILIYPVTEVIFTLGRRLLRGVSIFRPDIEHLHLKLFYFFKPMPNFNKVANALVAPVLSFFWLFPLIFIPWVYQRTVFIIIAVSLFLLIYLMFYIVLLNLNNQKNKIK